VTPASSADKSAHWAVAFALTTLVYVLAGFAGVKLAIPPGYASPLYPAAGIAIASVMVFGWRMLPAVALGACIVNLSLVRQHQPFSLEALPVPLVIAFGAALQAGAGAALVQRFVRQPLSLTEPRDVLLFMLAGAASCLVNATIANAAMAFTGTLTMPELPFSFGTWWVGDLLGVLIGAPVVLTLIGRPRDVWVPRRRVVGLTLTLLTLLLALGIRQIIEWNNERIRTAFEHDASNAALALTAQLRDPLSALEAMRSLFIGSENVTPEEMRRATRAWLAPGALQAIAWSERVERDALPAFENRVRSEGDAGYRIFDRPDGASAARTDDAVVAIHYIEPVATNARARGLNLLSVPAVRPAVDAARRNGTPTATAGFRLTQQAANETQVGVVLYQALYSPEPSTAGGPAPQTPSALRGVISVTVRMDDQLKSLASHLPTHLQICLVDTTPGTPAARLSGTPDCEKGGASNAAMALVRPLNYGGRQWEVRVSTLRGAMPATSGADVWLFALVGLLSTATLGGFLLTMTGRTHRIEAAVLERTAALQAEVHERQMADAALRESEQRFRNILNHIPIGVIYTDLQGVVRQTNPRFCELIGYTEQELLTLSPADYTHPADMDQDAELMAQLVRGDLPAYRRNKRFLTKGGTIVWVQATVSLLRYADGKPRSVVGVVEDITEHLRLEEAEHAREAAEASNRAKSEFLSRMSHELRTPLNAMLGFAQLLELDQRNPLKAEQLPWVSQIQQAGWHLLEMINDVLDLSRIESGNLRLKTETLHLADLVDATIGMVEGEARPRNILITQRLEPGTATVLGDSTRVKQILTNLLSNAVKYNADGGRVHITTRAIDAETVEIAVNDTGLGLTPEQLGELFQPFNRLGRERSSQQGTGIGLVISQRLADLMGGSLTARSVAGEGSSFMLTLPCSPEADTVRSDLDALAPANAAYHKRIVHYVEDNETNVEVMRGILAQRPQVEMQVSITGLDGLAAIRAHRPDLILLDMHLPDISGMELLKHLKNDPRMGTIPIIVVSADALAQQIEEAFDAGCTHYLTKPVSVAEVLNVLDDQLERMESRFT
jgi:PAS domain S-box-containing protein